MDSYQRMDREGAAEEDSTRRMDSHQRRRRRGRERSEDGFVLEDGQRKHRREREHVEDGFPTRGWIRTSLPENGQRKQQSIARVLEKRKRKGNPRMVP
ncbi:hypothetical protein CDL15_Pgr025169 [Punica granatum]|uniref:Uncharacterized protein n=1 Tax=Punica granatum TaxID=22663 RepID=A0A218WA80_PUNGR|nr:hypothetical protein CDL15_Pgr025169 [Punica granatum]PKI78740.1 hypothetical protein CRG98_000807 [Punica granatum]